MTATITINYSDETEAETELHGSAYQTIWDQAEAILNCSNVTSIVLVISKGAKL